jgi:hypothetical protein
VEIQLIRRTIIAAVTFLFAVPIVPGASRAAPILAIGSDTVHVGDVFEIPVSISGASGLTSFQFDLAFNPAIVKVLGFDDTGTDFETAAINGGGSLTGITGFTNNTAGQLSGVADSMSGVFGPGLTSGSLASIDFEALAVGVSALTLSNAFLTDNGLFLSSGNLDFGLQNGQVTVMAATAVSEPSTLLVLIAGLALLAILRSPRIRLPRG